MTTQTDVSSTETSKPTKCAIAAAPSPMLEVRPTPIQLSYVKGLHVHRWKDQAQPPRYTIFVRARSRKPTVPLRPLPAARLLRAQVGHAGSLSAFSKADMRGSAHAAGSAPKAPGR